MLLFLFSSNKNFGQENMSKNVLMKAIHNRNNYTDLTAQVSYNIKSFGDIGFKEMEYSINLLKDDSFYLEVSKRPNLDSKMLIYEYGDSSHMMSVEVKNQTFVLYGIKVKNNKRNSHVINRVFGRYYDSSFTKNLIGGPKDTQIYDIPCWELIVKPYNSPVSKVISSSIFISKDDYLIRGFWEAEIFENLDTTITSSFIKCIYFNPNEIRNNIAEIEKEMDVIKSKYSQKPPVSFKNDEKSYTGFIDKLKVFSIEQNDSIFLPLNKGKYLLDFWFIGCYPCMKSFPYLDSLENEYKTTGIHFIKLNPLDGGELDKVKRYSKLHSIELENYLIPRSLCSNFSVDAYPSFIFIEDGKIIKKYTGFDESVYNDLKLFLESWTKNSN
jgi:thiol-disulfide isomerase/thioredoxin